MRQHHAVARRNVRSLVANWSGRRPASSRDRKAFSWALAVMSGRAGVEDPPQVWPLPRARPADVVPFLTSLSPHTPQVGELRAPDTEHAFRACSDPHHRRSRHRNQSIYTHILAINPGSRNCSV